jgi:hypothetical protein
MKHNTAGSGLPILLSGSVDFQTNADSTLSLIRDRAGYWYEIGRKV